MCLFPSSPFPQIHFFFFHFISQSPATKRPITEKQAQLSSPYPVQHVHRRSSKTAAVPSPENSVRPSTRRLLREVLQRRRALSLGIPGRNPSHLLRQKPNPNFPPRRSLRGHLRSQPPMGKKRGVATVRSSKPSSPAAAASPARLASPVPEILLDVESVKQECERSLNALQRGNHNKALRLMKESAQKYDNSALIHRVSASVSAKVAGIIDDPAVKHRHLKNAIGSARRAVSLSPNSIEFAHFYATLLFDVANDAKDYEEVVLECEKALGIENPTDPAKENLLLQPQEDKPSSGDAAVTSDARIAQVQYELRSLIQKSNIASISTWMKNLGGVGGEEKFRLIPLRRLSEDPVETRYLQSAGTTARRQNEIKKAMKTVEERRMEIEVRVAAARLLQKKSELDRTSDASKESGGNNSCSTGSGGSKVGERRRHGNTRKNATFSERKDLVKSFWDSMSSESKKDLLRIQVSDIKAHFGNSATKDGRQGYKVLSEALSFGGRNKSWRFWGCFRCGERFRDSESHMQHVLHEHMGNPYHKVKPFMPTHVGSEWEEMLANCSWEPLHLIASVRMLEAQSKGGDSKFSGPESNKEEVTDSWSDDFDSEEVRESSPVKESFVEDNRNLNVVNKGCDSSVGSKQYSLPSIWPLSDDRECAMQLEKISSLFQMLIRHKCLAKSHLNKVIQFTMEELHGLVPGSQILSCGLDHTPVCICFLGASQLRKIVTFLQDLCHACSIARSPEKVSPDDGNSSSQVSGGKERVVLNADASCILLDEKLLHHPRGDVGSENPVNSEKGVQSGSDSLLSWMYSGLTCGEHLAIWSQNREEKSKHASELLECLEKELGSLHNLCDKKSEHTGYEKALLGVEDLCLEENRKREHDTEFSPCSYDSILRKRRDELVEDEVSNRLEIEAISNILRAAEAETYGGVTSHMYDLEAGEDDWKSKGYLDQMDTCIRTAIQQQKEQVQLELRKIEAKMLRSLFDMQQLEHELERPSAFDYRSILVPLVKSFLRAHLEDLKEKDATEKSDAAREAFLAELALDAKKGSGNDNVKQDKAKDKKKNKDSKRNRDTKTGSSNVPIEVAEESSVTTAHDVDPIDTEMMASDSCGIEEQEDFQRKIELEAEERKLAETLEYQRRIENEAKQKLLAEQQRRNALAASEGDLEKSAGAPLNGADKFSESADGLANEGIQDDLPFEQRPSRKGKRRNSTKVLEGGYQVVSYETEKANLESATTDILKGDQFSNQDSSSHSVGDVGSKTLRQLQAEEDEEERFLADLKKAVMQSLDTFEAQHKSPSKPSEAEKISQDVEKSQEVVDENVSEMDVGPGLQNEAGEYNCFLNVVIQSLWHLRRFREEFLKRPTSEHVHVGNPCVVCALFEILSALSMAVVSDGKREPVSSSSLRIALSNLYPKSNFFQEGQMNDASEVLGVIFDCLHRSFTSNTAGSVRKSVEGNRFGSYDCSNASCIAHTLFGMDIFERMNCYNCGWESRHLKYTSFFHNINANALRRMKVSSPHNSFDELLNFVEVNHQLACDVDGGGCGKLNPVRHMLSKPPHVFTTVLGWQKARESAEDIKATLSALSTEIDISILYRGLDPNNVHRLVSVVCYYGQHYHCFAYNRDLEKWVMYDDKTVKVIGTWEEVLTMCEVGQLQPQVLFFEAVNLLV